jgi:hypothetical protein
LISELEGGFYDICQYVPSYTLKKREVGPNVMGHTCIPSTWEAEARGLQVQGQPGLQEDPVSKTTKKKVLSNSPSLIGHKSLLLYFPFIK